jgi:DNA-binding CsgD family transcriptional regulator
MRPVPANPTLRGVLTHREVEVLELAAAGLSRAEIARCLWLSVDTVKSHLVRAARSLGGTGSTAESVAVAWRVGYLEPRDGSLRAVPDPDPGQPLLAELRRRGRIDRPDWIRALPAERRSGADRRAATRPGRDRRADPPAATPPRRPASPAGRPARPWDR